MEADREQGDARVETPVATRISAYPPTATGCTGGDTITVDSPILTVSGGDMG